MMATIMCECIKKFCLSKSKTLWTLLFWSLFLIPRSMKVNLVITTLIWINVMWFIIQWWVLSSLRLKWTSKNILFIYNLSKFIMLKRLFLSFVVFYNTVGPSLPAIQLKIVFNGPCLTSANNKSWKLWYLKFRLKNAELDKMSIYMDVNCSTCIM